MERIKILTLNLPSMALMISGVARSVARSGIWTVMSGIWTESISDVRNMATFHCPHSRHQLLMSGIWTISTGHIPHIEDWSLFMILKVRNVYAIPFLKRFSKILSFSCSFLYFHHIFETFFTLPRFTWFQIMMRGNTIRVFKPAQFLKG